MFIAALAAAGVGLALPFKDREVRERWRTLAQRLGLTFQPGRLLESDGMEGMLGNHLVRIDNQRRQGTHIAVTLDPELKARIRPRHLWFFEGGIRPEDRLEFSDSRTVTLLRNIGLSRLFLILLDYENESLLDRWIYSAHIWIDRGELAMSCPERIDHPEVLGVVLGGLSRLAEGLDTPNRIAVRLGENARQISAPLRRRLVCFNLLLETFPESSECGRCAWAIAKGPPDKTREGYELRILALRHLDSPDAYRDLMQVIDEGLNSSNLNLRQLASTALLALTPEHATPRLMRAIRDPNSQVAMIALRYLPMLPRETVKDVESILLDLLYQADSIVRPDLVCVLAKLGTARAIGPLLDLERVSDPGLRRLCRYALEQLQIRFPERQGGSLSLAADTQQGEVALIKAPNENKSL